MVDRHARLMRCGGGGLVPLALVFFVAGCNKVNPRYDGPTSATDTVSGDPGTNGTNGTGSTSDSGTDGGATGGGSGGTRSDETSSGAGSGSGTGSSSTTGSALTTGSSSATTTTGASTNGTTTTTSSGCIAEISDITVELAIDHTWLGDLVVKLLTPEGSVVTLVSRAGIAETEDGAGETSGDSSNLEQASPIRFNDAFAGDPEQMGSTLDSGEVACRDDGICDYFSDQGVTSGVALSDVVGESALGTWTLCVGDDVETGLGTLGWWSIEIEACEAMAFNVPSGSLDADLGAFDGTYDGSTSAPSMLCTDITVP